MKKTISLFLAIVMILSLSACKSEAPAPAETVPSQTEARTFAAETSAETVPETATEAETEAVTEAVPETTQEAPEPVAEPVHLHPFIAEEYTTYNHPDTYRPAISLKSSQIRLPENEEEAYPELYEALIAYNDEIFQQADEVWSTLYSMFDAEYQANPDEQQEELRQQESAFCIRADSAIASFLTATTAYWGGPHDDYFFGGVNFDTKTGKMLSLADVVTDMDRFAELVDEDIKAQIPEDYDDLLEKPADYIKETDMTEPGAIAFTVGNEGVTVYFNPYAIGWFALGAQRSTIYFADAPEIFSAEYAAHPAQYAEPLIEGFPASADVNGDGKRELVSVTSVEEDYYFKYDIAAGNRSVTIDDWSYGMTAYLVCLDGKYYVYLFEVSDNDYSLMRAVDLSTMMIAGGEEPLNASVVCEGNYLDSYVYESTETSYYMKRPQAMLNDPARFYMSSHMDYLSTYGGRKLYHAGEDGVPVSEDKWYECEGDRVLCVKKEFMAALIDAEGNALGEVTVPEGTFLRLLRTDNDTFADLQAVPEDAVTVERTEYLTLITAEGLPAPDLSEPIYRITEDRTDWPSLIDGMPEEEVLEGIMYAG